MGGGRYWALQILLAQMDRLDHAPLFPHSYHGIIVGQVEGCTIEAVLVLQDFHLANGKLEVLNKGRGGEKSGWGRERKKKNVGMG